MIETDRMFIVYPHIGYFCAPGYHARQLVIFPCYRLSDTVHICTAWQFKRLVDFMHDIMNGGHLALIPVIFWWRDPVLLYLSEKSFCLYFLLPIRPFENSAGSKSL